MEACATYTQMENHNNNNQKKNILIFPFTLLHRIRVALYMCVHVITKWEPVSFTTQHLMRLKKLFKLSRNLVLNSVIFVSFWSPFSVLCSLTISLQMLCRLDIYTKGWCTLYTYVCIICSCGESCPFIRIYIYNTCCFIVHASNSQNTVYNTYSTET